ncbi:CaiB/BaiF CoA transferase family protein [Hoeflea alexandrii]|uniref:CaiB/BaiF CoA transferase family protein n=1 Tax=Hoeflea alexandrii TaxID=288436 RepID=UPI0022B054C4|nr:CoA transferase [Hoeflea alexandrii]MCZ4291603.1 CoA transferase [Hoeflea alexandrii]
MTNGAAPTLPPASLLNGVRVLDLTNVLSGPFCTYQMALLGAEVIKIENPDGGDLARSLGASAELNARLMGASFQAQNAGKKSLAMDLKSDEGRTVFLKLVRSADVLVENFRPGVMNRLGLGYETLRKENPRLIYTAISGFGQDGPLKSNQAYDQIIQGMSGIMSVTGTPETAPIRVGYPVADTLGGLTGAFATLAALFARGQSGQGQFIDVSMLDSSIVSMGWIVSNYLSAGVHPAPLGNENMTAAPSGTFMAADGPLNIAANKAEQFVKLSDLLNRPDLPRDPRFAERETRKRNREALNAEINAALASNTVAHWVTELTRAGVPAGPVLSIPQVLAHPQIVSRRLVQDVGEPDASGQRTRVARAGYRLGDSEPSAQMPPPELGQHTTEILLSLGLAPTTIEWFHRQSIVAGQ